ncbi:3-hydroxyacyl-CoA dehydrogenase/enoyl-CoA hydratase family protein [Elizabethkingia anophelis]|uniref:Enoyl-CoA hydratase [isoleucine degradation] / 3-hydroxyacyl-CoA dehydrogenase n=2 Tax=Elizabethkingia anophelis TaxID=1117645 RepID=A0A077EEL3_9FLAO|nr:3-hydroxyacyl-CoA dehydrogenase/enoyl-CoA hydratase family protein [Elizabethkingia anophelis]AIL46006.1 Enoyl-CoA hydratase [isoleucine degradation] / 3-hydroxyacyl-CoA dehydrogenase [Elizabethkingia anophelis NUHP1]AQX03149.1 3-hydroxyacyl-CoA dehydrogenase [Elizabethkingia anophelis]MBE9392735.1 3-hydroxyacyl-CoA dehydrogenase/enoyl-CoA hydratase family protein [Elizabethkingia anophelis]MBE9407473.1 3-hydroxyacyl-CoA dehydrogenase/enoyl-CoA hydratase family protein [Elizabethkingia anoph
MKRRIKHVTVLGSGIMGSGIAAHFANIGVEVLLLDIVPNQLTDAETAKGLTLEDKAVRNRIASESLQKLPKASPALLYSPKFVSRITAGNFDDDLEKIKNTDWIIEVVVERLDIKKSVYEKIEKYRKPGTLVSSNTSGIPIHFLIEGRSDDFKKYFAGTHFFNPVRYLPLLEIIPTPETDPDIVNFYMEYGAKFLGKTTVLAKDTPAFIANRIGTFGIMNLFHSVKKLGLTVGEIDKLTGPVIGRPKSATFRTADVVGLDTLVHVANGIYGSGAESDTFKDQFVLPDFVQYMIDNKLLGSKTDAGFFKKVKNTDGKSEILGLNLETLQYEPQGKASFPTLELTKTIDRPIDRFKVLIGGKDKAGEFYRQMLGALFAYASNKVPEISDEIYKIDDALRAGFGWENGPFEIWDAVGVQKGIELAKEAGYEVSDWVKNMAEGTSFYKINEEGQKTFFNEKANQYANIPGQDAFIILDNIRKNKTLWSNSGSAIEDLGDGIINFEIRSKMNSLGGEVLDGLNRAIDLAEKEYDGLVIGNQAANFSVGANLAMILMMAVDQDWDDLNMAINYFQQSMMRVRYSSIPVVVAPHGMTLGGGCEMTMHADRVVAAAETYIGLVEFGVGVIPGGGGSKELTVRTMKEVIADDVKTNRLRDAFMNIAMAKVATSAYEAYDMGILQKHKDIVVVNKNRQIAEAKQVALQLAEQGYTQPIKEKVKVLGQDALGMFYVGTDQMLAGRYISEHDKKIADKLGFVMAGGNLSEATDVSEQYLLNLEREAFLSLCGERKTLERIQYMLQNGKPLRN